MNLLYRRLLARNVGRPGAFVLGWIEADGDAGITFDDDSCSPRSVAYDRGRHLRRRIEANHD